VEPRSPVLDSLAPGDRHALMARAVIKTLARGQALYIAGDAATRAHLVARGAVKLVARNPEGKTAVVALALPGEFVGDVAALDGGRQPLDAVAATRSEVVGLDSDLLVAALTRQPLAAAAMARSLAERLRSLYGAAADNSMGDVRARLAGRLLELAKALGETRDGVIDLELPLVQEDLARLAGMCRESTCKTLALFKRAGLLDYRGRRMRVLRADALERVREGESVRVGRATPAT
jgi:CRP/FNR family transcriptional regulator, cyclic AMP receptor protein